MSLNSGIKNFLLEKVMSRFSIETLLSESTDKLGRRTLLCSTKTLKSKKIMDKSEGGMEGGRERLRDYHVLLSNIFVSVPEVL